MTRLLVLLVPIFASVSCQFDQHFVDFLHTKYGPEMHRKLSRADLKNVGSFGGGYLEGNGARPVILVHGFRNQAGTLWKVRRDFVAGGIPSQRIFATSWGGGETPDWQLGESLSCEHVLRIREFIEAVSRYANSDVDVVAYSMGGPLARKAILGGACVENGHQLGKPLTHKVHTFISVASPHHGSYLCMFPFGHICNFVNGVSCFSKFLQDINASKRYEGKFVYSIASEQDEIVGYWACGTKTSMIPGSKEVSIQWKNHEQTEFDTADVQLRLLRQSA
ncbi:unnamed protein product [Caenorhabditis auriculariae]|uniref:Uncharacterized protein n=1 Tax=Caenorhabditis auriculariae TaxID=2777116 RepID=A0A8S1HA72_9PELO|nr:unnamed protein product [Caenorhabditis auriculariae]